MNADDLRDLPLFAGLGDEQLAELAAGADEVHIPAGEIVFRQGDFADDWWVLLDGAIDLGRRSGRETVTVAQMNTPGQWSGGFRAWDVDGVCLATGRTTAPTRLLKLPATRLRELVSMWFPLAGHLIGGLHRTARSIESTARQRDALVTLGTLAAGLAHEINNPAAAAIRAVDGLTGAVDTLLDTVATVAGGDLTAAPFVALDALRRDVASPDRHEDPLARSDREDAVAGWLSAHDVDDAWQLAAALAPAGVDIAWCERVEQVLGRSGLASGIAWVAAAFTVRSLLAEVGESTRRVSELVGAVRSYSHLDQASRQRIDVRDGLESTLTMLGQKLTGIRVVREYAEPPEFEAYAGELNQVWTNLIDNAADAMEGAGVLTVRAGAVDDDIVVDIVDTGTGMPPEVAERVFEPFFTTKDVGKGTGLGLDIARRIVTERHGGTITIDPTPDGTTVRVRLPRQGGG